MKLALEAYSYRHGEEVLNSKPILKREIEDILLKPEKDIFTLSCDEYYSAIRDAFLANGWENQPQIVTGSGDIVLVMDLRKERIGIKFGLQASSDQRSILGFEKARDSIDTEVNVGLYITTTQAFQEHLEQTSGKPWSAPDFRTITKNVAQVCSQTITPICVLGLDIKIPPLKTIDLDMTASSILRELILVYLESKYGSTILKGITVKGERAILEFDGITRVGDKDVILALELGRKESSFPSRLRSGYLQGFAETVREYQGISGRNVCLRFIMMGDFEPSYIEEVFGRGGTASGWSQGIELEYELHSFADFDYFLDCKRRELGDQP